MAHHVSRAFLLRLVLAIAVLIGCYMIAGDGFQEYMPVEMAFRGRDCVLLDRADWLTAEHIEKMKNVLKEYNEPYKIRDGKLLISHKLKVDRDLTANYTQKARE